MRGDPAPRPREEALVEVETEDGEDFGLERDLPLLFTEVSKPKKLNSFLVVAIVISFLPSPRRMAWSVSGARFAANETWPRSFIDGKLPTKPNRFLLGSSTMVVMLPSAFAR